jgi:hypothetical protein
VALVFVGCVQKGSGEGGRCDDAADCLGKLVCVEGRCAVDPALHGNMARQSGVEISTEKAARADASGAVRVRSARGHEFASAVCNANERLVSGWCDPTGTGGENSRVTESGIRDYTESDTIGARWTCQIRYVDVRAYALCQRID